MMSSNKLVREKTQTQLLDAITQEHFVLYGQPIVALNPGQDRCAYVEVLIRYLEEERNALPPGGFIDVLEELKLMGLLDRWVVNRVMRSLLGQSAGKGGDIARYSINLSVDSLNEHEFPKLVREYLRKSEVPAGKVYFEVSEADAEANIDALKRLTAQIVPAGCGITITSYSGKLLRPTVLPRLGVDSVKISSDGISDPDDLNYTWSGSSNPQAMQLACAALRIRTIAEMVESSATLEAVKQIGFDYAQGFAVAEPAPLRTLMGALKQ